MRHLDALPAWVTRQRNRLLGRRSNEKIVRWINHRTSKAPAEGRADTASTSSNDNVAAASARAVQAN